MSDIENIYISSECSFGSYGDFESNSYSQALLDSGMTPYQRTQFSGNYLLLEHCPNTDSGFSSTVFKSSDGQLTVAIRGTEGVNGNGTKIGVRVTFPSEKLV